MAVGRHGLDLGIHRLVDNNWGGAWHGGNASCRIMGQKGAVFERIAAGVVSWLVWFAAEIHEVLLCMGPQNVLPT